MVVWLVRFIMFAFLIPAMAVSSVAAIYLGQDIIMAMVTGDMIFQLRDATMTRSMGFMLAAIVVSWGFVAVLAALNTGGWGIFNGHLRMAPGTWPARLATITMVIPLLVNVLFAAATTILFCRLGWSLLFVEGTPITNEQMYLPFGAMAIFVGVAVGTLAALVSMSRRVIR